MKVLALRFRPLEPIMLRGPGEFDPSSRGVYAYASSLRLPRPSVITGMLVSALVSANPSVRECFDADNWEKLLKECYIRVFDELCIEAIRGLYIVRRSRLFVPLILGKKVWLLDYYQAKGIKNVIEELLHGSSKEETAAKLRLIERDIAEQLRGYVLEPKQIGMTGIHLKSRKPGGGKVAEEGYIYTANYVSYPPDTEMVAFLLVNEKCKDSSSALSYLNRLNNLAVKLGGEGRCAKLSVEGERSPFVENIRKSVFSCKERTEYALLISPMPIERKHLQVPFTGVYAVGGYGFSIAKRRRKPLHYQLSEGSILDLSASRKEITCGDALEHSAYDVLGLSDYRLLGRLGYGTFISI